MLVLFHCVIISIIVGKTYEAIDIFHYTLKFLKYYIHMHIREKIRYKNTWIDQMIEYTKNHGDKCEIIMTDVTNPEYQETLLDDRMFCGVIEIK